MRPLEEIETQLYEAYQAFNYKQLTDWSDERLQLRRDELYGLQAAVYDAYGKDAKDALHIIVCEIYDIDDEQTNRSQP